MTNAPKIHVRDEDEPMCALCGLLWIDARGGRVASSTSPPVIVNEETGSANVLTCRKCWELWRLRHELPKP